MAGLSAENKLRDVYNPKVIDIFTKAVKGVWPAFDDGGFRAAVIPKLSDLTFGERHVLIRDTIAAFLPKSFPKAASVLIKALGPELSGTKVPFEAFIVSPQCAFVSMYGREHFDVSMKALYEMTKRFTAEGDVRAFLEVDFERAMRVLHSWCEDENPHVRRLVSEGTRSRLPLASRIRRFQEDPRPVIELLDKLNDDPSEYVRRSVANNINDIGKDNPQIAIETLRRWSKNPDPKVQWVVRHAARSLIKAGHPEVISLLGYPLAPKLRVQDFTVTPSNPKRGGTLVFSFLLESQSSHPQKIILDYALYYQKANGGLAPKVFKLRNLSLSPKASLQIARKVVLKNTSGRTIYPGQHAIEIRINGKAFGKSPFTVQ